MGKEMIAVVYIWGNESTPDSRRAVGYSDGSASYQIYAHGKWNDGGEGYGPPFKDPWTLLALYGHVRPVV